MQVYLCERIHPLFVISVLDDLVSAHVRHVLEVQREDIALLVNQVLALITETLNIYALVLLAIVDDLFVVLAESIFSVLIVYLSHLSEDGGLVSRGRQQSQHTIHAISVVSFYYLIFLQGLEFEGLGAETVTELLIGIIQLLELGVDDFDIFRVVQIEVHLFLDLLFISHNLHLFFVLFQLLLLSTLVVLTLINDISETGDATTLLVCLQDTELFLIVIVGSAT